MEQNITTLNLTKTKIDKLQSLGRNYCNDLTEHFLNSLTISLTKAPPTKTALDLLEEELLDGSILSFNIELDKVLRDEVTPKRITELAGTPGSGKTQICFQLCVTTQFPKLLGGLEGQVIYISTNKNFSIHRLRELSRKCIKQVSKVEADKIKHLTEEDILKNIYVITTNSVLDIFAILKYLEEFLKDKMVRLIVIDSISSPLRDVVDSKERSTITYKLLEDLQRLAAVFNFAVVITNDFTTRVKANTAYYTPSFGDSFFDRVNSRICLSNHDDIYVAELIKSVVKAPLKVNYCMF